MNRLCEICQVQHASIVAQDSTVNGVHFTGEHHFCMGCCQAPGVLADWKRRTRS